MSHSSNLFIYGRPVRSGEFLNREGELRTIFNRLHNCESTAVVGEPHIGKSSLLLQLAEKTVQQAYLGAESQSLVVSLLDLHPISNDHTPLVFWNEALEPLRELDDPIAEQHLEHISEASHVRRSLESLFDHLSHQKRRLVLLLDEFERLLIHPNFQDPSFFALLRSLATRTGGLALVITSRLSVGDFNEWGHSLLKTDSISGSPYFNNLIEVRLRPFDEKTVGELLNRAGDILSPDDRRFVRRLAGRHPFLLQAMAAALTETPGNQRHSLAAERFYERIAFHFDDLWRTLDDRTRTTAVILSLVELGGQALGRSFAYGEIEKADAFGPELRRLAERGLAEQVGQGWQFDWQHLLLWRGERWTVGAQAFTWWVRDVVIAGTRQVPAYDEWLINKRYLIPGLLTQQQWDWLVGTVRKAPDWLAKGIGELARALLDALLKG